MPYLCWILNFPQLYGLCGTMIFICNPPQCLRSWMGAAKDPPSDFPRDVPPCDRGGDRGGDRGACGDRAGRRPREEKGRLLVSKAWGR